MEWLFIAMLIIAFFVLPVCWIYDMFFHPEEFGPSNSDGHYNSDEIARTISLCGGRVARIPSNVFRGIEWVLHGEFMTKKA